MDRQKITDDVWQDFHDTVWECRYKDAPTNLSRWFMVLKLYVDAFETTEEETAECMAEIYDICGRMSLEDWKFVYRHYNQGLDLDLREEAKYQIKLKENGELSSHDWFHLFLSLDDEDPFRNVCMKKIFELSRKNQPADGGTGA